MCQVRALNPKEGKAVSGALQWPCSQPGLPSIQVCEGWCSGVEFKVAGWRGLVISRITNVICTHQHRRDPFIFKGL